jgi:hypothetical protein
LISSGWSQPKIREVVRKEDGEEYSSTGFRVKVERCRDAIEEHCGYLKVS